MESKKNLVLVGMMGSGKSTIGSILSKKLQFQFIDIDKKIEEKEGKKITTIFEKKGESYFRKLEEEITTNILTSKNQVVSLGGGGFINNKIQYLVLKSNISFWLNWKKITLINRITKNNKRPLAFKYNKEELEKIILERNKIYNKANYKINCQNLNKNEIVNRIIKIYEKI